MLINSHQHYAIFSILQPHDGHSGTWSQFSDTSCTKNFLSGVAIEIYGKGGTFSDARGATNLKMVCSDGSVFERYNTDKRCALY